jgi:hypothetical protein
MASEDRHSEALEAELITDPDEKARREARNGLRQFDSAIEQIEHWLQTQRTFQLRPSAIMALNRLALYGLNSYAGGYRPAGIAIKGHNILDKSDHLEHYGLGQQHDQAKHSSTSNHLLRGRQE